MKEALVVRNGWRAKIEKKSEKKDKKCGVACYLAGGALASSSSSLHSSISRFDELLLGAAFAVVAVTVFNYYCWY
jgi:hypothetical protein